MKTIKLALIVVITCLISCNGSSSKTVQSNDLNDDIRYTDSLAAVNAILEEKTSGGDKLNAVLDDFFAKHPNSYDNDIQREKAGKELHSLLKEQLKNDPEFLSDIPVEFASLDKVKSTDSKGGYKYLTSFFRSRLTNTGNYAISFKIITALSEQDAATLKDNNEYYIKGEFVDLAEKKSVNLGLDVFDNKMIEIGGIFIKDPTINPTK